MTEQRYNLICMRLDEMWRTHPDQITGRCHQCNARVGIYPSGQGVLSRYRGRVDIVCNRCCVPSPKAAPAPGALDEARLTKQ